MRRKTRELHLGRINGDVEYQPKEMGTQQSVNLRTERRHFGNGIWISHEADAELGQEGFLPHAAQHT